MLADSYIVPECVFGPGSFGGLMALYESNYLRLMYLLGTVNIEDNLALISSSVDDEDLFLSVESVSRYTQVLRLTYQFDEPEGFIADPDLCIRVYLDARMTEVVSWAEHHRHTVLRDLQRRVSRQVNQCWRRNMVLSKWLDFLLDKGHAFQSINRCAESADQNAIVL